MEREECHAENTTRAKALRWVEPVLCEDLRNKVWPEGSSSGEEGREKEAQEVGRDQACRVWAATMKNVVFILRKSPEGCRQRCIRAPPASEKGFV